MQPMVVVMISLMGGATQNMDVDPSCSVAKFKTKIYELLGVPVEEQHFFVGAELADDDDEDLSYYNV